MRSLLCLVVTVLALTACRRLPPPIRVDGRTLIVENRSREDWRDVTITVNAYYRAAAPTLAAGGQLDAGLSTLTTGFGQHFNPVRESVHTVEVKATGASGKPVSLDWSDRNPNER